MVKYLFPCIPLPVILLRSSSLLTTSNAVRKSINVHTKLSNIPCRHWIFTLRAQISLRFALRWLLLEIITGFVLCVWHNAEIEISAKKNRENHKATSSWNRFWFFFQTFPEVCSEVWIFDYYDFHDFFCGNFNFSNGILVTFRQFLHPGTPPGRPDSLSRHGIRYTGTRKSSGGHI